MKSRLELLRAELEEKNHRLQVMRLDVDDYKRRFDKLKKKLKINTINDAESLRINQKSKLDDLSLMKQNKNITYSQ